MADEEYLEFASARSGHLFRTACLLTGDWHLAEDLVQETLGKVYRSWRKVSRADNPAAYSEAILVRTFLSHRRRRSSAERPTASLPDRPGTGDAVDGTALRMTLLDGLARLPVQDRAVLVLRFWEDRSVSETATVLHLSAGAVRNRSMRALERLREVLGDQFLDVTSR
ncbi:RNA polymerase sigma-70 factor, sigma-E family [Thermomonospora echinospora]|uniref:RNA polymerase sigma-70 factor, sigma-E family n=1 Tax=Thermomonospora echinospora TaxID=1992 RepID=A0A1H6CJJ1_9ACTN|nr:SigE family RNA polymerase sigma factor [Thermomonospora echinospora]SEG72943.1 RNA polymerase sigma-70 factor, sigma-E family [Thermomonospora echinospora]